METKRLGKAVLYVALSLDGYIAAENDDLSFLKLVEKEGEDYGFTTFMKGINASLMGRRTFDWVLRNEPDYIEKFDLTYLITHHPDQSLLNKNPKITAIEGDVAQLVVKLLSEGMNLFITGGADVVYQLLEKQLIDEFHLAIIPVLLGKGTLLFKEGYPYSILKLLDVKHYETGLVMLRYKREQNGATLVDARENN